MIIRCTILLLVPLLTGASSDCDACVAGRCHRRKSLLSGFPVTDQLAIDRTDNILYLQLYGNQNIAIGLDDLQISLVNVMKTSGRAFDQKSQVLYLGTKEVSNTYYKYDKLSNTTDAISITGSGKSPNFMFYDRSLHFIDKHNQGIYLYNTMENAVYYYTDAVNYTCSNFVITGKNLFFVSKETVYSLNIVVTDDVMEITKGNYVLSVDSNDNVYLLNANNKTIYKRDDDTGSLDLYAFYNSGAIEDFVFDRNNQVVFRESGGNVAQWVPTLPHKRCSVEPPHSSYFIREFEHVDDSCIN